MNEPEEPSSWPPQINANDALGRLFEESERAWEEQDYPKSIQLLEKAHQSEPSNLPIMLNLARAHGMRYDYPAATRWLEKAIQASNQCDKTLEDAAQCCLEFDHMDMAIRYLERSSRQKNPSLGVLITLADIFIRDGRFDDAADLVIRAGQIDKADPRVLLEQAALHRAHQRLGEAETLFRELLGKSNVGTAVRIRALYELAGIYDRSERYDQAMTALLEAKAIQRTMAAPYVATLQLMQRRAREMEQTLTAGVLERWRNDAAKLQPSRRIALLCGHPRSGTTLLEQVLDSHDDIVSAEETKMMHDEAYLRLIRDFPEGTSILESLDSSPPSVIMAARENYYRCTELFIQKPIGQKLLIDKNPGLNLMIPMVVRIFPEAKFLVAIRDPRDVIVSCFFQALPLTPISSSYLGLESAVKQYASVMGFWLEMQPRMGDRWMQIRYEELVEDLPGVADQTLRFLGVGFDPKVLNFHEHARNKRVKSPSHADVIKPVYKTAIGRWRNYQRYLEPYEKGYERFVKTFNYA